jgi:hypothetical protein
MILFSENVFRFPYLAYLELNQARNRKEARFESLFYWRFDRLIEKISGFDSGTKRSRKDVS